MHSVYTALTQTIDPIAGVLLGVFGIWMVIVGLEDLIIDAIGFRAVSVRKAELARNSKLVMSHPQKRLAIIVPCWREHQVIARMVQQNLDAIRYSLFEIFIGVYPNDEPTMQVVGQLADTYPNVHRAVCPHDGPTSKADCLNWIYQRIVQREEEQQIRFEAIVTHDAEDVIHPDALHWINFYCDNFDMVQIPVLPLPTPLRDIVHGIYCDEFTEYQSRDMPARGFMGAFIPSNGVGTGFRRAALETLANHEHNRIFEPACLTEDYENGYRLRLQGARECFLPLHNEGVATREFFPRRFHTAIRQRTRWTTGIALQTWDRHGWKGHLVDRYWLWRDRKGLLGNPISFAVNLLSCYGLLTGLVCCSTGAEWGLTQTLRSNAALFTASSVLGLHRLCLRSWFVQRIFGWRFVLAIPVRTVAANAINTFATFRAIRQFGISKLLGKPLAWVKTEHWFPSQASLGLVHRPLEDVLVELRFLSQDQMAQAIRSKPATATLTDHLIQEGLLSSGQMCTALSQQSGLPKTEVDPASVDKAVARAMPLHIAQTCGVLPFRVEFGSLLVAVRSVPDAEVRKHLRSFTTLQVRFYLVTIENWRQLATDFL